MLSHPDEERFCRICPDGGAERSEEGLRQFLAYESRGIRPESPDPYFTRLLNGKKWWEWTIEQYRTAFKTGVDWFGFYTYRRDFKNDHRGFNMIFGGIRKGLAKMARKRRAEKKLERRREEVVAMFTYVDGKVVDNQGRSFDWLDQALEANNIDNPFMP